MDSLIYYYTQLILPREIKFHLSLDYLLRSAGEEGADLWPQQNHIQLLVPHDQGLVQHWILYWRSLHGPMQIMIFAHDDDLRSNGSEKLWTRWVSFARNLISDSSHSFFLFFHSQLGKFSSIVREWVLDIFKINSHRSSMEHTLTRRQRWLSIRNVNTCKMLFIRCSFRKVSHAVHDISLLEFIMRFIAPSLSYRRRC